MKQRNTLEEWEYGRNDHHFFEKAADDVARWLLGKILCRRLPDNRVLRFRITETEAYGDIGNHVDSACHGNKYKSGNAVITQRMTGGTIYVHYRNNDYPGSSFDVVAGKSGEVQSVLIRGAIDLDTKKKYSKIRKLGEALHIDYEALNQSYLLDSKEIWLEDDGFDVEGKIDTPKQRIRLGKADVEDINALRRFVLNA